MPADVSPYAIFGRARCLVLMTPKAAANHAALLSSDAPSDMMHAPYLGVHVRRPFCLFGHVTPHGPIRDALDVHTSQFHVDFASELAKLNVASAPYTTDIDQLDYASATKMVGSSIRQCKIIFESIFNHLIHSIEDYIYIYIFTLCILSFFSDQNLKKGNFHMAPFWYPPEIRFAPLTKQPICLEACKAVLKSRFISVSSIYCSCTIILVRLVLS